MNTPVIDAARLSLALNELRLPAIKTLWPSFAERADKEGWTAAFGPVPRTRGGTGLIPQRPRGA